MENNNIDLEQSDKELEELESLLAVSGISSDGFINLDKDEFTDFMKKLRTFYNNYDLKDIDNDDKIQIKNNIDKLLSKFDIYIDYEQVFSKTKENQEDFFILFKNTIKEEIKKEIQINQDNIDNLIKKLIINTSKETQKELANSKNIIDRLVAKMKDTDRKEFIETLNVYMDIKKELNELPDLLNKFKNINNQNDNNNIIDVFSELMKDINRFSINKIYKPVKVDGKEIYDLTGAESGIPDIQLFYLKDTNLKNKDYLKTLQNGIEDENYKANYEWFSKSASITKSSPYRFEKIQNNIHSFKTLLKQEYLNKYLNDNSLKETDFKDIHNIQKFLTKLPSTKRDRFKNKLDTIDSLSGDVILAFEDLDLTFNQIEEYLEIHRRYIVDFQRTSKNKEQQLNTVIWNFVNENNKIKGNEVEDGRKDIENFLKDKNDYIKKRFEYTITKDTTPELIKRRKKPIKVCEELIEYNRNNVVYTKNLYDHSNNKTYLLENGYKTISEGFNKPLLSNQLNHNHSFVVISNEIVINKFSGKVNDNEKLNTNEKLSHFILLFSHLKNEIDTKYNNTNESNEEKLFKLYFDKNIKIHESYSSKIIYSNSNLKNVKISESNFNDIIQNIDNDFIIELNKIIQERELNKTLTNNLHSAITMFYLYSKNNDVNYDIDNLKLPTGNIEGMYLDKLKNIESKKREEESKLENIKLKKREDISGILEIVIEIEVEDKGLLIEDFSEDSFNSYLILKEKIFKIIGENEIIKKNNHNEIKNNELSIPDTMNLPVKNILKQEINISDFLYKELGLRKSLSLIMEKKFKKLKEICVSENLNKDEDLSQKVSKSISLFK